MFCYLTPSWFKLEKSSHSLPMRLIMLGPLGAKRMIRVSPSKVDKKDLMKQSDRNCILGLLEEEREGA